MTRAMDIKHLSRAPFTKLFKFFALVRRSREAIRRKAEQEQMVDYVQKRGKMTRRNVYFFRCFL